MDKKKAIKALHKFNDEYLGWRLKTKKDINHSDADVIIWRRPMMYNLFGGGECIIFSEVSHEECLKEYNSYWSKIIYGTNRDDMVDYYTYEFEKTKYYVLVD